MAEEEELGLSLDTKKAKKSKSKSKPAADAVAVDAATGGACLPRRAACVFEQGAASRVLPLTSTRACV
jgi:hypothetical protein